MVGNVDDETLKVEFETCKRFFVDSEMDKRRHKIVNFALAILDAHTLSQKPDIKPKKLKCAQG